MAKRPGKAHISPVRYKKSKEVLEDIARKSESGLPAETWYLMENLDQSVIQLNRLDSGFKEAEYYQRLTLRIDGELSELVETISKHFQERRQLVSDSFPRPCSIPSRSKKESELINELIEDDSKSLDECELSEEAITTVRLARNAGNIKRSIINTIDKVIELKMNLLR